MNRTTKLASAALIALTLAGGAYTTVQQLAGDPSQWGVGDVYKKGSFDITETEQPIAGSKGKSADARRDSSFEIAGSKGDMGKNERDPSIIAGSAGTSARVARESS